ncbi:hypothetical protein [Mycoplasma sp. 1458C]|uniref:hypothetical protein n=1 Tax=unclassified Mycoplasma TaxID=2683645 RepID=UPI003AAA370C
MQKELINLPILVSSFNVVLPNNVESEEALKKELEKEVKLLTEEQKVYLLYSFDVLSGINHSISIKDNIFYKTIKNSLETRMYYQTYRVFDKNDNDLISKLEISVKLINNMLNNENKRLLDESDKLNKASAATGAVGTFLSVLLGAFTLGIAAGIGAAATAITSGSLGGASKTMYNNSFQVTNEKQEIMQLHQKFASLLMKYILNQNDDAPDAIKTNINTLESARDTLEELNKNYLTNSKTFIKSLLDTNHELRNEVSSFINIINNRISLEISNLKNSVDSISNDLDYDYGGY